MGNLGSRARHGPGGVLASAGIAQPANTGRPRPVTDLAAWQARRVSQLAVAQEAGDCRYRGCRSAVAAGAEKPGIFLCAFHLMLAAREYEAYMLAEQVCPAHGRCFATGHRCPECCP
jgi:hypothetical protein